MRGFSLLEVVVALTILSAGLVGVLEIHGRAARGERMALDRAGAVVVAEAVLAETLARPSLTPGSAMGEATGGIRWRRQVLVLRPTRARSWRLWRVVVTARPPRAERPVRLETLTLAPLASDL